MYLFFVLSYSKISIVTVTVPPTMYKGETEDTVLIQWRSDIKAHSTRVSPWTCNRDPNTFIKKRESSTKCSDLRSLFPFGKVKVNDVGVS